MLPKIFIKVSILFCTLAIIYSANRYFSSNDFKKNLSDLFTTPTNTYTWCPEHTVDFIWLDERITNKWKNSSPAEINKRFCKLTLETIHNINLETLKFTPLLKAQSAEAKESHLEWSPESKVFKANGLPFYSESLIRELLDR